jgi:hypothetical protein
VELWEIHPALVHFPIAFFVGEVLLDLYVAGRGKPVLVTGPPRRVNPAAANVLVLVYREREAVVTRAAGQPVARRGVLSGAAPATVEQPAPGLLCAFARREGRVEILERCGSFVAQLLISQIFLVSGLQKILDPSGTAAQMRPRGMFWVPLFLAGAILFELGGGFSLLIADWVKKITGDRAPLEQLREWEHLIVGAYSELRDGYKADPGAVLNNIARVREHLGLVLEQGINFTSLCYHHFLPFYGTIDVAYEPTEVITGLGRTAAETGHIT